MFTRTIGLLSTVNDLTITVSNSTLFLTWEPPFTLDITSEDPDITGYCVDVVDSTSSTTLLSQCGINETEYSYPLPQDAVCHSYVLSITPVNVIGRGISSSVLYIGTEAGTCTHVLAFKIFNVMSDFCPYSVVRLSLNSCIIVLKCPLVLLSL